MTDIHEIANDWANTVAWSRKRRDYANNVLRFFRGDEGYSGGSFIDSLLTCLSNADETNIERIRLGLPDLVELFLLGQRTRGGLERLREIGGRKVSQLIIGWLLPDAAERANALLSGGVA